MFLLGYDLGSSSVKASIIDAATGLCIASAFRPQMEMPITAKQQGWAEQAPEMWWRHLKEATQAILRKSGIDSCDVAAIGISYQMHGLVAIDRQGKVLRDAIIWCDSRAVATGDRAFARLGERYCFEHLLNHPGNFTASKLGWIRENEPDVFSRIHKIMLPGDYIAYRMTGEARTTMPGLSEGMFWDYSTGTASSELLEALGIPRDMLAEIVPTFGRQGELLPHIAEELGLKKGTPVTYRAGDQPNNAFSLNVLNPGEIAANAGTSGVVYGVTDKNMADMQSRINTVLHVNHQAEAKRLGLLLCINGVGSLMSWVKRNIADADADYHEIDKACADIQIGSEGVSVIPFGNGAERILKNVDINASFHGINFNTHNKWHLIRAAQEGVAFSFKYGMDIMRDAGMDVRIIRAGNANMFKSPVFREALANISDTVIELYDADGSIGAAKGAGVGAGIYSSLTEAFSTLDRISVTEPASTAKEPYRQAYTRWLNILKTN